MRAMLLDIITVLILYILWSLECAVDEFDNLCHQLGIIINKWTRFWAFLRQQDYKITVLMLTK